MKTFLNFCLCALLCAAALLAEESKSAAPPPKKMSELYQERLKRLALQIQVIQDQVNAALAPINAEQKVTVDLVCKDAGFAVPDCAWNTETGEVSKKAPVVAPMPPATPVSPPATSPAAPQ